MHDSLQTIAALALPTCSRKDGLELLRLLTINGALLRDVFQDLYRIALCNTLHEALYVVALMWYYSLPYGWAMETSVSIV